MRTGFFFAACTYQIICKQDFLEQTGRSTHPRKDALNIFIFNFNCNVRKSDLQTNHEIHKTCPVPDTQEKSCIRVYNEMVSSVLEDFIRDIPAAEIFNIHENLASNATIRYR